MSRLGRYKRTSSLGVPLPSSKSARIRKKWFRRYASSLLFMDRLSLCMRFTYRPIAKNIYSADTPILGKLKKSFNFAGEPFTGEELYLNETS